MKKNYVLCILISLIFQSALWAQSPTIAIYNSGDISSDHFSGTVTTSMNSNCPGTLTVPVPVGRYVTSIDVEYQFEAIGFDWISEQSSYLECVTTSTKESAVTRGPSALNNSGVMAYSRAGLNIANGVVPTGGLQFKIHAWRSFTGGGCTTTAQRIKNNSFKVTVHHVAAPTCLPPSAVTLNTVTATSANISWTTGGASNWQIEYGPVGFTPGTGTLVQVGTNPYTLNGLNPSTRYDFRVRDSCGVGDVSFWINPASFRTNCSVTAAPWSEDFESVDWNPGTTFNGKGTIDTCFSRDHQSHFTMKAGPPPFLSTFSGPSGDHTSGTGKYAYSERLSFGTFPDTAFLTTPPINLGPLATPELTFWYHMFGADVNRLQVFISNNGGVSYTSIFVRSGQQQTAQGDPWKEAVINLSAYANDTVTLKFISYQTTTGTLGDVAIDDLDIHEQPTCPKPVSLQMISSTSNSITLGWTSGGASNWQIEYGTPGFTLGTGTLLQVNSNPFMVTGLSASTGYEFYVRDSCSASDVSFWSQPMVGNTTCAPLSAPYFTNFNGPAWDRGTFTQDLGTINSCWTRDELSYIFKSGPGQFVSTQTGATFDHTNGNASGKYLYTERISFTTPIDTATIVSVPIDLSPLTTPEMSFWYHMFGADINRLTVYISNNHGASYSQVGQLIGQKQNSNGDAWKEIVINLSAYANDTILIKFEGLHQNFGTTGDICIDDLSVHEQPTCPKPQDLEVVGVTNSTATLQWTTGGATNWQVEYGGPGFTIGTGTLVSVSSNPFTITGLSPNTSYEFYVRDSCGVGDVSAWVGAAGERTDCNPVAAPYTENFDGNAWGIGTFTVPGTINQCWRRDDLVNYQFTPMSTITFTGTGASADHTSGNGKFLAAQRFFGSLAPTQEGTLTSQLIDLTALTHPELTLWYHMFGADIDSLKLEVFDGSAWSVEEVLVGQQQTSKAAPWEELLVDLGAYANDTIKLRFKIYRNSTFAFNSAACIDDIDIHEQPTCPKPSNFTLISTSANSVTLGWTSGGATQWNIEYGSPGFIQGLGTRVTANTNPFTVNGLNSSSTYEFYVRDSCSATDTSLWVGPLVATTDCLPLMAPFSENFDNSQWTVGPVFNDTGSIGQCWNRTPLTTYFWKPGPPLFTSTATGPSGDHTTGNGKFLFAESIFGGGTAPFNAYLETPLIAMDSLTVPELSFWYHMHGSAIGGLSVEVDDGSGYTQIWNKAGAQHTSNTDPWKEAVISLAAYANDTIQVRFIADKGSTSTLADVALDDIDIHEAPSCPKPQDLVIVGKTNSTVTLSWTTGGASNWNIEYGAVGFTPGSGTLINAASNPFTVTGLSSNTGYEFYVRDSCGLADVSEWIGPAGDTTDCNPVAAPYMETFDGNSWQVATSTFVTGNIDPCWESDKTVNYQWGARSTVTTTTTGPSSDHTSGSGKFVYTHRTFGTVIQSMSGTIISPLINTVPLSTPEMSFWYHMFGADIDSLTVEVFNGNSWSTELSIIGQQQNSKADAWKEAIVDISSYANDTIKVRFVGYRNSTFAFNSVIAIDDLSVHEQPSCPKPSNLSATASTGTSVTLGWTSGGASNWQIEYGPSGFPSGTGTIVAANTNPFTVSPLSSSTTYDFYVRDSCGVGDVSEWFGPFAASTDCLPVSAPLVENFDGVVWQAGPSFNDSGDVDMCWIRPPHGDYLWRPGPPPFTNNFSGPSGDHTTGSGKYIFAESIFMGGTAPFNAIIESPAVDLSTLNNPELRFWYHMFGTAIGSLVVEIDNGSGFIQVWSKTGQQHTSNSAPWTEAVISLSSYLNDTIVVRFKATKSTTSTLADAAVDDFSIDEDPNACSNPSNINFTTVGPTAFTLNWTSIANTTVEIVETGQPQGSGVFYYNAVSPLLINGLASSTSYDIYLRDSCGTTTFSQWIDTVVTTLVCPSISASFTNTNNWLGVNFDGSATTNADSIHWDFGDGNSGSGVSSNNGYATPGSYVVTMSAFSDCGDTSIITQTIQVCDTLTASFSDTAVADSIIFDASASSNATSYKWKIEGVDTTGQVVSWKFNSSGTQTVTLTVYNACGDSVKVSRNVNTCPPAKAIWTYNVISTTTAGMKVQFDGTSSLNAVSYDWDFGDGNTGIGPTPQHTYVTPGLFYTVRLTVKNNCGNPNAWAFKLSEIGLEEIKAIESIKIYPNPTDDYFTMKWESSEVDIDEVALIDASGKVVYQQKVIHKGLGEVRMDVSNYSPGTYFVKIISVGGEFALRKLVIE